MIKVNVEINNKSWHKKIKKPQKYFKQKLRKISKINKFFVNKNIVFTILLTNSLYIKKLNKEKKKNIYIGDIAICFEVINSRSKKNSFIREFDKVWVHGLLHLLGYNHIKDKDYFKMYKFEKRILRLI